MSTRGIQWRLDCSLHHFPSFFPNVPRIIPQYSCMALPFYINLLPHHLVQSPRVTMTRQTSRSSIHVLISAAVLRLVSRRSWSIKVKDWPPREARPCVGSHRTSLVAASSGCRTQWPAIRSLLFLVFVVIRGRSP